MLRFVHETQPQTILKYKGFTSSQHMFRLYINFFFFIYSLIVLNNAILLQAGVLDALLSAMRAHPGSLPLQRRGAAALLSLCSGENCQLRAQKAEEAKGTLMVDAEK